MKCDPETPSASAASDSVLRVAVASPLRGLLDYLPPAGIPASAIPVGVRVRAPLGRSTRTGVVLAHHASSEIEPARLRRISEVLDDQPLLTEELIGFLQWVSDYCHHPIGEVLADALPGLLRGGRPARSPSRRRYRLTAAGRVVAPATLRRAPRQAALLGMLRDMPEGATRASLGESSSALPSLLAKGLVEAFETAIDDDVEVHEPTPADYALNPAQRAAIDTVLAGTPGFAAYLLDGITGSGKTEVYLQLVERLLASGGQALVLIPEIGLTPQTSARLRDRLALRSRVMHSGLADGERLRAWLDARDGRADVVIGTRSAIFAPLPNLALVIVDEEHDLSYKQQDGLRYSARDLAVVRAHRAGVPVLLGSATPSLETLLNVRRGRYTRLALPQRTGRHASPRVEVVDVRSRSLVHGLSPALLTALEACLAAGEQALLFLNRRGYAPVLMCHGCGWLAECRRCDAHLVYHRGEDRLRCHHCDAVSRLPETCPQCGAPTPRPVGLGTQRIAEALTRRFPQARIARVDRDSMRARGQLQKLVDEVDAGTLDILVGTQMLAKGHHFPAVTLVAVIDADGGLFSADFRAAERMAQLVVQVAGRAGRGDRPGRVLLQTHHPQHPLLTTLVRDGYASFAERLLAERAEAALPPFATWALLRAEAPGAEICYEFLREARRLAERHAAAGVRLLGPVAAPMERRAGRHRVQLLVDADERAPLHALLRRWLPEIEEHPAARRVRWSLDVDPQEML